MLLFRFVCSFTTPVRVIFLYHIWCINKPSYPILYIYIPYAISSKNEYTLALSYIGHKLWNSPSPYMVDIYISINCWMT